LSVLFFYQRLFVVDKSNWKNLFNSVSVGMMVVVILWTVSFFLAFIFTCYGRSEINGWLASSDCYKSSETLLDYAVSDFITHFALRAKLIS
jgi:hypothetical protein